MSASFYNVVITNASYPSDQAAPSDGFIDFNKLENYGANLETITGLTNALSLAKRRANVRYREIVLQTNLITNVLFTNNQSVTNATISSPGSAINLQLLIEHGDSSLYTADELNPGQFLTGTAALTRMIARGMQYTQIDNGVYGDPKINVYDPTATTTTGSYGGDKSYPRTGERIVSFAVGALAANLTAAAALITITNAYPSTILYA